MPDTSADDPVRILARELACIGTRRRVRRAVGIAFKRDGGHRDDRTLSQLHFQVVIFRLTLCKALPPSIVVDDYGDVIGIVERRSRAVESGVVKVPFRRSELPDQPGEVMPVFVVTGLAAISGEVELVPPLKLGCRRQRQFTGSLAADEVTADGDQRFAPLRP